MRKLYLSLLSMLVAAGAFATNVTFKVDMTGQTVNGAGVHVAGSFQGWDPSATVLTDEGNGIWSVTLNVNPGYYEYKFVNGAQWGNDESPGQKCNINGNRAISVGSTDIVLNTVPFGGCEGEAYVLFQVNLKNQALILPAGVHVAGNFQSEAGFPNDWTPGDTRLYDNGDSIFKFVTQLPAGSYEYKFLNGNSWGDDESVPSACATNGNRGLSLDGTKSVSLPAVEFGGCPPGVIFRVDMTGITVDAAGVHLAGSFNSFDPAATMMTDKGNGIWEATLQLSPGNYEYKFVNGNTNAGFETISGTCANSNGNREIAVTGSSAAPTVRFGGCLPKVTFRVDMSNETVSADSVHIAGAFQGWNPGGTQMTHIGNNIYEVVIEMAPGTYQYKFVNGNAWGFDEAVPSACNVSNNREIVIGTTDSVLNTVCFKQCTWPCATNPDAADITFRVDMNHPDVTVEASGVWLIGSFTSPAWQDGRIQMTDADADMVYEATVNISGAADIQYKFSNGEPAPGSAFQNGETGDFATLGCGASNGIGGFNRTHTRSGVAEVLDIVTYNFCERVQLNTNSADIRHLTRVYPNPASQKVRVEYNPGQTSKFSIKITDLSGKVVKTLVVENGNSAELNIADLSSGAYLIVINDLTLDKQGVHKLIVE